LPFVISFKRSAEHVGMLPQEDAPGLAIVEIEQMASIGFRQTAVATDDYHVFVIVVGRTEAKIVRASDDHAVDAEGIDYYDLVMNDGEPEFCEFLIPSTKDIVSGNRAGMDGAEVDRLSVPKTLSELMTRRNRLGCRNDRDTLFRLGRLGLAIQVEVAA
jgi:hypothetical protein